jgi:membrane-associated phospholipid phosphatase
MSATIVMKRCRSHLAGCLVVWLTTSATASADSPYKLDLPVDIPILVLGGAVGFAGFIESSPLPTCAPACSPSHINALDRTAIHFKSNASGAAADVLLALALTVPVVLDGIDTGTKGWFDDTFVFAQALLLTQGITQLTKFAVHRKSPALYGGDASLTALKDTDADRSFFSAHASSAFAVTTAFAVTYWLRHPDDPMRFVVLVVSAALSLLTGTLKVLAGAHFWTDVVAGAAVGGSVGMIVPLLHVPTPSS